jgi:mRNA interferase MazF
LLSSGDIVVADFPGVQGLKRRPAIVVSSDDYHQSRPDVILGLITTKCRPRPDRQTICWAIGEPPGFASRRCFGLTS